MFIVVVHDRPQPRLGPRSWLSLRGTSTRKTIPGLFSGINESKCLFVGHYKHTSNVLYIFSDNKNGLREDQSWILLRVDSGTDYDTGREGAGAREVGVSGGGPAAAPLSPERPESGIPSRTEYLRLSGPLTVHSGQSRLLFTLDSVAPCHHVSNTFTWHCTDVSLLFR